MEPDRLKERLLLLHFSLIDGVGPATIAYIMARVKNSSGIKTVNQLYNPDDFYSFTHADWVALGLVEKMASLISKGLADSSLLAQELARIEKQDIKWVTVYDDSYPWLLKQINQPPTVLYFKGVPFEAHQKTVALIGSRAADVYAQRVISSFVPPLVEYGWSIVSGGALGADSMAHHETLAAHGKTIAVLGSGLLRPYPRSNAALFDMILEKGGTMVSAFPLTTEPKAGNFPARNRIIAGLSSGCIVVQAAHKSGASITAQYALDQGRSVFAVPGMIDNPLSAGCHALLQEGATVAAHIQDILAELEPSHPIAKQKFDSVHDISEARNPIEKMDTLAMTESEHKEAKAGFKPARYSGRSLEPVVDSNSSTHESREKQIVQTSSLGLSAGSLLPYPPDSIESLIIRLCIQPCSMDDITRQSSLSAVEVQQVLFDLQLDGIVRQNFAGQWVTSS